MVKVHINFRQKTGLARNVSKDVEFPVVPQIGGVVEYEEGWGAVTIPTMVFARDGVSIDFYGPQFDEEELAKLKGLGWKVDKL